METHCVIFRGGTDPLPEQVDLICARLDCTKYEARSFLVSKLPRLGGRFESAAAARDAADALRAGGIRCLPGIVQNLMEETAIIDIRRAELDSQPPAYISVNGERVAPDPDSVFLILMGTIREKGRNTQEKTEIKLVPGSLMGGMPVPYRKTTTQTEDTLSIQQVAALYSHNLDRPVAIQPDLFDFTSLGSRIRPTRFENFQTLVKSFREIYPRAVQDETLMRSPLPETAKGEYLGFDHRKDTTSTREAFWRAGRWIAMFESTV